jgi:glycogen operon protein
VGSFPYPFHELNGRYRDAARRYWKGDDNLASELGYRLTGSADLFQGERRHPQASVNFVTAHDGFTLHDLVSYSDKHNEANGEHNQDGSDDNQSWNHGAEGETDDPAIIALRDRQMRNLLSTLFLSQGVPMLLGGDEIGRTQRGNNNAYCQDNEISWYDWNLDDRRRGLLEFTRRLIGLRRAHSILQQRRFFVGDFIWESQSKDLAWLRPDGAEMTPQDWQKSWISALAMVLGGDAIPMTDERGERLLDDGLLILMNAHHEPISFKLPAEAEGGPWLLELDSGDPDKAAGTPCAGDVRGRGAGAGGAAPAAGSDGGARGGGGPGAGGEEGGAAAAAARRDPAAAVLDPLGVGRGDRRHPGHRAALRPGRAGRASRCCSFCPSTARRPPIPARTRRSRRSRWIRSTCRWTRARTSRRRAGRDALADDVKQRIAAAAAAPRVDWPACAR